MAVQSIRTPVQIRDVASDHLFVAARKMPFGEMDGVSQFDHATQEVRPRSEALDDAGNSLSPRAGSPEVVGSGGFSGGFSIFDDPDFCGRLGGRSAMCARRILRIVVCIHIVRIDGLLLIQSTNLLLRPRWRRPDCFAFAGQPSRLSLYGSPGGTHTRCSESKLQGKLDQARRQRRKNLIEGWRTDVAVGQAEIRVVQKIEELSAELKLLALGYANVLER